MRMFGSKRPGTDVTSAGVWSRYVFAVDLTRFSLNQGRYSVF